MLGHFAFACCQEHDNGTLPFDAEAYAVGSEYAQAAMRAVLPKKVKRIDVRARLGDIDFKLLAHGLMPASEVANATATKAHLQREKGVTNPLVYVELREWTPFWATVKTEGTEPKHLRFAQWHPSFDRWACLSK